MLWYRIFHQGKSFQDIFLICNRRNRRNNSLKNVRLYKRDVCICEQLFVNWSIYVYVNFKKNSWGILQGREKYDATEHILCQLLRRRVLVEHNKWYHRRIIPREKGKVERDCNATKFLSSMVTLILVEYTRTKGLIAYSCSFFFSFFIFIKTEMR